MQKKVCILGSTGSIGRQVLKVIENLPQQFKVNSLAAGQNIELLAEQINLFKPKQVVVPDNESKHKLASLMGIHPRILTGENGLNEIASEEDTDIVLVGTSGIVGLIPTLTAISAKKTIALANKETLVVAGEIVLKKIKENSVKLIPVDSEHSAIFQSLQGENLSKIAKIILTASGGAFYNRSYKELKNATPLMALQHPNWQMGKKITIDSATLMNKGLEVIEAHWLFGQPYESISVLVHAQSIIHSLVEFIDGSVKAQLGVPDMCIPIQYALTYPDRLKCPVKRLDLAKIKELTFELPDTKKFPCLKLAYIAGKTGGTMPAALNAANDVCVELFLNKKISFYQIPDIIERVMSKHSLITNPSTDDLFNTVTWAKKEALSLFSQ